MHSLSVVMLCSVLARDGYLFLRSVLPPPLISAARSVVLHSLDQDWHCIDHSLPINEALIAEGQKGMLLTGYRSVTHHKDMLRLIEGTELTSFLSSLFDTAPSTYDLKWCRVMGNQEFTDEHTDYFRFAGQAKDMITCWYVLIFRGTAFD